MRRANYCVLVLVSALIAACGGGSGNSQDEASSEAVLTAATLGQQNVLAVNQYLADEPYASADRSTGRRLATMCVACHSLNEGGQHMIGPNLFGLFGSNMASRGDFDYSAAAREAEFVWTPRALDAWLAQPAKFLPGNRMTFAGVRGANDRRDIIAYLLEATSETSE